MKRPRRTLTSILALSALMLAVLVPQLSAIADETEGSEQDQIESPEQPPAPEETSDGSSDSDTDELQTDPSDDVNEEFEESLEPEDEGQEAPEGAGSDDGSGPAEDESDNEGISPADVALLEEEEIEPLTEEEVVEQAIDTLGIDLSNYLPQFHEATCESLTPSVVLPSIPGWLQAKLRFTDPTPEPAAGETVTVNLELKVTWLTWSGLQSKWVTIASWTHSFDTPVCHCADWLEAGGMIDQDAYAYIVSQVSGNTVVHDNWTTTATVTGIGNLASHQDLVGTGCYIDVAFSTYSLPGEGNWNRNPVGSQQPFRHAAVQQIFVESPGLPRSLGTIDLPQCGFQTDLYVTNQAWNASEPSWNASTFTAGQLTGMSANAHDGLYVTGNQYGYWGAAGSMGDPRNPNPAAFPAVGSSCTPEWTIEKHWFDADGAAMDAPSPDDTALEITVTTVNGATHVLTSDRFSVADGNVWYATVTGDGVGDDIANVTETLVPSGFELLDECPPTSENGNSGTTDLTPAIIAAPTPPPADDVVCNGMEEPDTPDTSIPTISIPLPDPDPDPEDEPTPDPTPDPTPQPEDDTDVEGDILTRPPFDDDPIVTEEDPAPPVDEDAEVEGDIQEDPADDPADDPTDDPADDTTEVLGESEEVASAAALPRTGSSTLLLSLIGALLALAGFGLLRRRTSTTS